MTIKKSERDMLVRRDAEGREEFVAWGERTSEEPDGDFFRPHDARSVWHVADRFTVIPRDRIEVTDDVADLGPGWRVRALDTLIDVEVEGTTYVIESTDEPAKVAGLGFHNDRLRLISAWRVLPETPSEVEALADAIASIDPAAPFKNATRLIAEHLHAQGYRKIEEPSA